jgi:hypothetical protein
MLKTFSIVVVILFATVTNGMAAAAAAAMGADPEERLGRLPLLYRGDARAFFTAINPLLNAEAPEIVRNPYKLYMEATLWGRVFGVLGEGPVREQGLNAVDQLATTAELRAAKRYWLAGVGLDALVEGHPEVVLAPDAAPLRRAFESHFGEALRGLIVRQNIFAYYVKGILDYDGDLNSTGAYYLRRAADGFCQPALDMLTAIYQFHHKSTAIIEKKLRSLGEIRTLTNADEYVRNSIRYAIENAIFENELTPKAGAGCCYRAFATDYAGKFAANILAVGEEGYEEFYGNVHGNLTRSIFVARLGYLETGSHITPFMAMVYSTLQLYYVLSHFTPPTADTAGAYSYAMARDGGIVAEGVTLLTLWASLYEYWALGANLYEYIHMPRFVHLPRTEADREVMLTALWCAASRGPVEGAKAMSSRVFGAWVGDVGSCTRMLGCGEALTLSRIALNRLDRRR